MLNLNLLPYQKVASIGCGGGLWEVMASFECDNVEFHLQEVNNQLLNETQLQETIQYFEKHFGRPTNCSFQITIGTEKETNLTSQYFDKVLLINSFHEFACQNEMLAECQRILKPTGQLIIEEQLAKYAGELHKGCGKRLFLELELIEIFKQSDIEIYAKANSFFLINFKN